jgi:hypothetical protein
MIYLVEAQGNEACVARSGVSTLTIAMKSLVPRWRLIYLLHLFLAAWSVVFDFTP